MAPPTLYLLDLFSSFLLSLWYSLASCLSLIHSVHEYKHLLCGWQSARWSGSSEQIDWNSSSHCSPYIIGEGSENKQTGKMDSVPDAGQCSIQVNNVGKGTCWSDISGWKSTIWAGIWQECGDASCSRRQEACSSWTKPVPAWMPFLSSGNTCGIL